MAAGLAGGSSDAAGALFVLNTYFENKLSKEELTALAIQIGADVPFVCTVEVCVVKTKAKY